MSTFDGVINKAKSFINVTGKKTKLQMAKLNKEAELQKKYELLGRICYANLKSKDENFKNTKSLIEEIEALDNNIKTIAEKILTMKDIKICPKCGNKNDKKSIYCSFCGEQLYINNNEQQKTTDDENSTIEIEYDNGEIDKISIDENTANKE